jgi:hypothetical protein
MPSREPDPRWQHPWLRIQRVLKAMLTERWDPAAWRRLRREIPKALAERGSDQAASFEFRDRTVAPRLLNTYGLVGVRLPV